MTGNKRFSSYTDYMNGGNIVTDNGKDLTIVQVIEILNGLNDEIEPFYNLARDYNIPFNKLIYTFEDALNSDTVTTLETEVMKLKEENEQLKQFKDNVQRVLQSEYNEYSDKVWSTWIKALSYKLRVDLND